MVKEKITSRHLNPFLPPAFKFEKLYAANLLSLKKKEATLEFFSFNSLKETSSVDLLRMPETRYWASQKFPYSFLSSYTFCLKNLDRITKTFHFSMRKKKLSGFLSLNERFFSKKGSYFEKARFLSTFKSGYKFSAHGCLGKMFLKRKKKLTLLRNPSALLFHLSSYSFLKNLNRSTYKVLSKKIAKRRAQKSNSKRFFSYFKKNSSFESFLPLKKGKKDLLHLLIHKKI